MSEVINLKNRNINLDELTIHLKNAKGKKDRITIFPEKLKADLSEMMALQHGNEFLFESERGGKLNKRTAQMVFEKALLYQGDQSNAKKYQKPVIVIQIRE